MPMVPEAVVAMLACARIGAVHSVVFGGFAPAELAARIDDAAPVAIISASCGIEPTRVVPYKPFLDEAIERSRSSRRTGSCSSASSCAPSWRPGSTTGMSSWPPSALSPSGARRSPRPTRSTSSTPPGPPGSRRDIVRDNGGHAVALAWSMPNIYGVNPGETMFTASDVGWVVGHSYIVYGPLLVGATTILYEGKPVGTPDAGAFWRILAEYGAVSMFTAPTAFRAIKREDARVR